MKVSPTHNDAYCLPNAESTAALARETLLALTPSAA